MLTRYHVKYAAGHEIKTFKVKASSKQQAYNIFRNHHDKFEVVNIINFDNVLRLRRFIFYSVIIALFIGSMCLIFSQLKDPTPVRYTPYTVISGDSMWKIARNSDAYDTIDTRHIVHDMIEKNNNTSDIHPGQIVFIPMYER